MEVYLLLKYTEKYMGRFPSIVAFTDLLQFCVVLFSGLVQILENLLKFSVDQRIQKIIDEVDASISSRHTYRPQVRCTICRKRNINRYLVVRLFCIVLAFSLFDVVLLATIKVDAWYDSIIIRSITIIMLRIGIFQVLCDFYWVNIYLVFQTLRNYLFLNF